MIGLVVAGRLPSNRLLRRYCLSDPEVLLALAAEASGPSAAVDDLCERFSLALDDLRMGGVYKRTNRGRLIRTEEMLRRHIAPEHAKDLVFLDVGASDGITTIEALRALRQAFGEQVRGYAADLNIWLLRYRWGPLVEYRAADGEPIMVRLGPFGLRLARQRHGLELRRGDVLVGLYLRCRWLRRRLRFDDRISLVNPLAQGEPALAVLEFDCLRRDQGLRQRISAIRASNVLNLNYFRPAQISGAVGHFHAYLRSGGCLVISQNGDGVRGEAENGSVWIKAEKGFCRVDDFGRGSEVASLVDAWRPAEPGDAPRVSAGVQ
jgi:hypothetical protein